MKQAILSILVGIVSANVSADVIKSGRLSVFCQPKDANITSDIYINANSEFSSVGIDGEIYVDHYSFMAGKGGAGFYNAGRYVISLYGGDLEKAFNNTSKIEVANFEALITYIPTSVQFTAACTGYVDFSVQPGN